MLGVEVRFFRKEQYVSWIGMCGDGQRRGPKTYFPHLSGTKGLKLSTKMTTLTYNNNTITHGFKFINELLKVEKAVKIPLQRYQNIHVG